MTPKEIIAEMSTESLLNRVRRVISNHHANMDAQERSRRPPSGLEYRRMEFDTARALIALIQADNNDGGLEEKLPVVRS